MDAAYKSNRKFPAYTLAQLKALVAGGNSNPLIVEEIAKREANESVALVVPQFGRPGDEPAIMAEETGIPYELCLVLCNCD